MSTVFNSKRCYEPFFRFKRQDKWGVQLLQTHHLIHRAKLLNAKTASRFSWRRCEGAVRQQIKPAQSCSSVVIVDKAVNHGQVVEVMDRLRRVKGRKLAIATQKRCRSKVSQ